MTIKRKSWIIRFWEKVKKDEYCWNWTGGLDSSGYGQLALDGTFLNGRRTEKSHRLSWMLKNGDIPKGSHVLHKCDNRKCCNVNHLFLGTNSDNIRDKVMKNRQYFKISYEEVQHMRFLKSCCNVSSKKIGKIFNIDQSWAWRIINKEARAYACS